MMTALRRGLLILLAVLPMFSHAALTAHQVIQQTTDELLADLKANKEQYRNDPAAFYDSLNEILGPAVCGKVMCCLFCAGFVALMIFCQPVLNLFIALFVG